MFNNDDSRPLLHGRTDSYQEVRQYDNSKITFYLIFAVSVSVLSSFQFGWNLGSTNSPEKYIRTCSPDSSNNSLLPNCIPMDNAQWGVVVGMFSLGGLVGGFSGGNLAKRFGCKLVLWLNNLGFILGGLLMALSWDLYMFGAGRFFLGAASGIGTACVPMYITEITPLKYRGSFGVLHQLGIVVGILSTQILGLFLSKPPYWRFLLGLTVFIALLQVVLMPFSVESPRFLLRKGNDEAAQKSLRRLRGTIAIESELDTLMTSNQQELNSTSSNVTILDMFKSKSIRSALAVAIVAQLAQQFSGINGVVQFSTTIFEKSYPDFAQSFTVGIGVVNLLMTIVSVFLMDRAGRRSLMLVSQFGLAFVSALVVTAKIMNWDVVVIVAVTSFVAIFAIGLGPVPWLIVPEIFPSSMVAQAASIGVMVNWTCSFIVTVLFPLSDEYLGDYSFVPFGSLTLLFGIFMFFYLPETKGKSVDEIIGAFS